MEQATGILTGLGRSYSDVDVAKMLGVSVQIVRRESKKLGVVRMGRKYVFFEVPLLTALQNMVSFSQASSSPEPYPLPGFSAVVNQDIEERHGLLA